MVIPFTFIGLPVVPDIVNNIRNIRKALNIAASILPVEMENDSPVGYHSKIGCKQRQEVFLFIRLTHAESFRIIA